MYTHTENIKTAGKPLSETGKALIMVHGRGATAESILSLAEELQAGNFSLFAPQATNHSWYPYSFIAPAQQNQPALDSALEQLRSLLEKIKAEGVKSENIYLLGFSQGACLTLEFAARNAQKFGGVIAFTGGLIGEQIDEKNYSGNFNNTPVLITTGNPDPHVPVSRVEESAQLLEAMGAQVAKRIYAGRPHTILQEEIELAKQILGTGSIVD